MSRARLGLYVFCRQALFASCYELAPTFTQFLFKPSQLCLVAGEVFPATRTIDSDAAAFPVTSLSQLSMIVQQMAVDAMKGSGSAPAGGVATITAPVSAASEVTDVADEDVAMAGHGAVNETAATPPPADDAPTPPPAEAVVDSGDVDVEVAPAPAVLEAAAVEAAHAAAIEQAKAAPAGTEVVAVAVAASEQADAAASSVPMVVATASATAPAPDKTVIDVEYDSHAASITVVNHGKAPLPLSGYKLNPADIEEVS